MTDTLRIIRNGKFEGDVICRAEDTELIRDGKLTRNITSYALGSRNGARATFQRGEQAKFLLHLVMENGKSSTCRNLTCTFCSSGAKTTSRCWTARIKGLPTRTFTA